jgi:ankyrin repeat protein
MQFLKVAFITLLSVNLAVLFQDPKQQLNDQLWEAVRKGDAASVTALLDKGADVNAKFRYGTTALFKAAERGHTEIVKILLARGADASVKDTFYKATAMTWALDGKHVEVVKLLLQKVPDDADDVLTTAVSESNQELVQVALATGKISPQNMTVGLAAAMNDPKNAVIVEMLTKAGAVPPPTISAPVLQSYAGKYRGDPSPEITISVKDGKLIAVATGQPPIALMPLNETTFRPVGFGGMSLIFNSNKETGKVVSCTFKQGQSATELKRIEETKQP